MTQPEAGKPTDVPSPTAAGHAADAHLRTDKLGGDLRGRSVRGGALMLASQGTKFTLTVISTAILARVLTPADFGLIAMVTAVTSFIGRLKEMGLSGATIQRAEITHEQVSTLFWVNVGFGCVLAAVMALCAPIIGWFYGRSELIPVALALGGTFIFTGLGVQHQALLKRQMRFSVLAVIEVLAPLAGMVAAVIAALAGLRYWALVIMQVVMALCLTLSFWVTCGWRPGWPSRHAGVRSMLAFGGNLTLSDLLISATRQLDKLLLGWRWGAGPLGFYSKAYQLLLLPIQQIAWPVSHVAIPGLSRLQDDPGPYRSFYCQGLQIMAALGMPIVMFMFVAADNVVLAVLGPQWGQTVPIFRLLAPAAFVGSFSMATEWLYISQGQTGRQLRWVIVSSAAVAAGTVIGLRWGPMGVATGFSIAIFGLQLPGIMYCVRTMPVSLRDILGVLWRPTIAAIGAGVVLYGYRQAIALDKGPFVGTAVDLAVYLLAYGLVWLILPGGRRILGEVLSLARLLKERAEPMDVDDVA